MKWKSENHEFLHKAKYATWEIWLDLKARLENPSLQERRKLRYLENQKAIAHDKKIKKYL